MSASNKMTPTTEQIESASKDIAWEYAAMLAAALEMAKAPHGPVNHMVQETFLLHVRNLAVFFRENVEKFIKEIARSSSPPLPFERLLKEDNVNAVDLCSEVLWDPGPFEGKTKLMIAINKTLSHLSYSRPSGAVPFDGRLHAHGTVKLMLRTWKKFVASLNPAHPEYKVGIEYWLGAHTKADDEYGLRVQLIEFENAFEARVKECGWQLNQSLDGAV